MKLLFHVLAITILCASCAPKIATTITSSRPPVDNFQPVEVLGLNEAVPDNAEVLGTVRIGDTGFSVNCAYDKVIEKARHEARKVGGNALKITEHKLPSAMGSSCHRIQAQILHVPDIDGLYEMSARAALNRRDSALYNEGCAVVHFYRYGGAGAFVGYDISVGDEVITRARNNSKESIKIKAMGPTTFWARTESRAEITVDILPGYHYYIRCSIGMGVMVGRPILEHVSADMGRAEYESVKNRE